MNTMKKVVITLAALLVAAPALAASGAARTPDGEPASGAGYTLALLQRPPDGEPASGAGRTPDGEPASGAGREQR